MTSPHADALVAWGDLAGSSPRRQSSVALLGFGTVGRSVAKILCSGRYPELRLSHIFNRDVARKRADWVPADVAWMEDIEDVLRSDADVVVEVVGGREPARTWIARALQSGRSVVTANKQVIAECGPELLALAHQASRSLRFEAAVAGGVPIIHVIEAGLAGDELMAVSGVLNGTCNYVLTRMEVAGVPLDLALGEAQALGYAEADPAADLDGLDARAKLVILAMVALRCRLRPDRIVARSIRGLEPVDFVYARGVDCAIRQLAWAERRDGEHGIAAGVGPALVPLSSSVARVDGHRNLLTLRGRFGGETTYAGFGAGGDPTAVAVVSDLLAIARGAPRTSRLAFDTPQNVRCEIVAPHYARLRLPDRPRARRDALEHLEARGLSVTPLEPPDVARGFSLVSDGFSLLVGRCASTALDAALVDLAARAGDRCVAVCMPVLFRDDR